MDSRSLLDIWSSSLLILMFLLSSRNPLDIYSYTWCLGKYFQDSRIQQDSLQTYQQLRLQHRPSQNCRACSRWYYADLLFDIPGLQDREDSWLCLILLVLRWSSLEDRESTRSTQPCFCTLLPRIFQGWTSLSEYSEIHSDKAHTEWPRRFE